MIELTSTKILMAVAGITLVVLVAVSLIRRSNSAVSSIDIDDLLLGEDGKLSKAAAVMMGSFAATTWIVVYMTLTGKMTEGFFAAYLAAWVAPTVTKLIVNRPAPDVVTTKTSSTSTTSIKAPTE